MMMMMMMPPFGYCVLQKNTMSHFMLATTLLLLLLATMGSTVTALNATELDCQMRRLAVTHARRIQPWRHDAVFDQVFDALQLHELCGDDAPLQVDETADKQQAPQGMQIRRRATEATTRSARASTSRS